MSIDVPLILCSLGSCGSKHTEITFTTQDAKESNPLNGSNVWAPKCVPNSVLSKLRWSLSLWCKWPYSLGLSFNDRVSFNYAMFDEEKKWENEKVLVCSLFFIPPLLRLVLSFYIGQGADKHNKCTLSFCDTWAASIAIKSHATSTIWFTWS